VARTAALRPIGIGEILDRAIDLSIRHFPTLAAILAAYELPLIVITAQNGHQIAVYNELAERLGLVARPPQLQGAHSALRFSVALIVEFVLGPLAGVALILSISSFYLGKKSSIVGVYRTAVTLLGPILGISVLYAIPIFAAIVVGSVLPHPGHLASSAERLGSLLFALAGLFVITAAGFAGSLTVCAIARERVRGPRVIIRTLRRVLAPKRVARSVGALIVSSFLWTGTAFVHNFAWSFLPSHEVRNTFVVAALASVPDVVFGIVTSAFIVIYYYDIRIREEAFDLHVAADAIEQQAASVATA
jgi:hypothetical protein